MRKSRIILLTSIVFAILVVSIVLFQHHYLLLGSFQNPEYFVVKSANITYEGHEPILYVRILNTGKRPTKVRMVYLFYEKPDFKHYVGASAFIEEPEYPAANPLIVMYGSNPVPPEHEAVFKAKLGIHGSLKPGTYIIKAVSEGGAEAFYSVEILGKKVKASLQGYTYKGDELTINLNVENVGDVPFALPSDDLKVYVDGKPWQALYHKEYLVAPGERELVQVSIPIQLIPYSDIAGRTFPYVDVDKQTVSNFVPNPEFAASLLREHVIIINVLGTEFKIEIPPISMKCKILDVEKSPEKDVKGQLWWHISSITLEITSQWIDRPDLGWFNKIKICVGNLCEPFSIYKIELVPKKPQTYVVTIYPSAAYYPASDKECTLHVYYGEIEIASTRLT